MLKLRKKRNYQPGDLLLSFDGLALISRYLYYEFKDFKLHCNSIWIHI